MTGGGTAGHVVPNFAVIEELRKDGEHKFLYIGSRGGVEEKMAKDAGLDYRGVACGKFRRYFSFRNFLDFFKVPIGFFQARGILKKFHTDVLFSKGGFVGVPVVLAAASLKIPIVIHESDFVPGLANKIAARFAKKICVSFEESKKYFKKFSEKIVVTGNPVRVEVGEGKKEKALLFTGLSGTKPVILVVGGSQGAAQINNLVWNSLGDLLKTFEIVHICGRGKMNKSITAKGYAQYEYLSEEIADVYALSDLIISRGGANSLAEIAFLEKKALIIPLGKDASRGDQIKNAEVFAKRCGWEVLDSSAGKGEFLKGVEEAYNSPGDKCKSDVNGAERIAEIIFNH